MRAWITNRADIATTPLRKDALDIAEAAYDAIDTEKILRRLITVEGDIVRIDGASYDMRQYDRIKILGFGKASCKAVEALEGILGNRVSGGAATISPTTPIVPAMNEPIAAMPSAGPARPRLAIW